MTSIISMDSGDSDVFFVEQLSNEPSPQRNNFLNILYPTEPSGTHTRKMPTISSVEFPELNIVTLDDNSNGSTFPYGFGAQQPIAPPSLNDPYLPLNPFIILPALTVVQQNSTQRDENCSPQSQSHPIYRTYQQLPWTWIKLVVGKLRIPQRSTTLSIRRMSQDEYTGRLPKMKLSIRKANLHEFICCTIHPRRRHLARWLGSWRRECPFQKAGECHSMSATPAENWFPQQRTFWDRLRRTKNSRKTKTIFMHANKLTILFTYI